MLIHASLRWHDRPVPEIERRYNVTIPRDVMQFGGIVGCVELVEIVTRSDSVWFEGPYGWVLSKPRIVPFKKWRGGQTLFDVPYRD